MSDDRLWQLNVFETVYYHNHKKTAQQKTFFGYRCAIYSGWAI